MGKRTIAAIFMLGCLLLQMACGGDKKDNANQSASGPDSKGGKVYQKYCTACHGADGKLGLSGAANLSISVLTKEQVVNVVTNGGRLMVPFKDKMTPQEIDTVSEYVLTLRK